MPDAVVPPAGKLSAAARKMLDAHKAAAPSVTAHAEEHRRTLRGRREEAGRQRKIDQGIGRQNAGL